MLLGLCAAAGAAQAERPAFQAPFPCGQVWDASTYGPPTKNHAPDSDSIDVIQRNGSGTIIGKGQTVLASAPGKIAIDQTLGNGLRYIMLDHADNWRTHYLHIEDEPGTARLTVGRKIARGEAIGRTGKSGADTVHIHYTQVKDTRMSAAEMADAGFWDKMGDGEAVRSKFNGRAIATHAGNRDSYNTWGTDRAEKIRSRNCTGGAFTTWQTGGQTHLLRYDPGAGRIRVNTLAPGDTSSPQTLDMPLGQNWTGLTPFFSGTNGQAHLMLYDFATGRLTFRRMAPDFSAATALKTHHIHAGWTHLTPLSFGGRPYFAAYDSRHGHFNVARINVLSDGFSDVLKTNAGKGFTHLVPYEEGPRRYVLMYKAGNGKFSIRQLTRSENGGAEQIALETRWSKTRRAGWSHFALMLHEGRRFLLGYDDSSGAVKLWQIEARGAGLTQVAEVTWPKGFTAITPYRANGKAYILAYDLGSGATRKFRLRNALNGFRSVMSATWQKGFR